MIPIGSADVAEIVANAVDGGQDTQTAALIACDYKGGRAFGLSVNKRSEDGAMETKRFVISVRELRR